MSLSFVYIFMFPYFTDSAELTKMKGSQGVVI